jgi:hypothetical protein
MDEIISSTTTTNRRSMAVMERLGVPRDPAEDFDVASGSSPSSSTKQHR